MASSDIRRLEIYRYDFGAPEGSEAGYLRPVVVIQSDYLNDRLNTTIVVPVTSSDARAKSSHKSNVLLECERALDRLSVVQLHLMMHVNKSKLLNRLGELECEENIEEIDDRLSWALDLPGFAA